MNDDRTTALIERLETVGGLETLPTARAAIEKMHADLAALDRGRLRPDVVLDEEYKIRQRATEDIASAYDAEAQARLKRFEHERGRVLVETAGVDAMPATPEARRALETEWAAQVPALIGGVPFIIDTDELEDLADLALVRESPTMIRTLVPAVLHRLRELQAEPAAAALEARFAEWRTRHPTHKKRYDTVVAREAQTRAHLTRSRDMVLEAHGLKPRY